MDLYDWLTKLFINHSSARGTDKVRWIYFCSELPACEKYTLNKLENFTLYLATSPFPIQLFHWFFPMFRSFLPRLHSRKWKNLKFNLKFIHTEQLAYWTADETIFWTFFLGQIAIYYYIISQQQRAKNVPRLFSVVALVICRGSKNNIKILWLII